MVPERADKIDIILCTKKIESKTHVRASTRSVDLSLLVRGNSLWKKRFGPSTLFVAVVGGSRWAGSQLVSNSILYDEGGPQILHTFPSTTWYHLGQRERSTSSRWRERGGAHCRPGVRDTRVCRASFSPLSNGSFRHDGTVNSAFEPAVRLRVRLMNVDDSCCSSRRSELEKCTWCKMRIISSMEHLIRRIYHTYEP